ncbi:MAG: hypothetical protein KF787_00075 [Phycisphaeraceae bacterium]|nr:hypothetical protein [Phycisphaerae bacterium]MBX3391021.1 hypothetical protein [Phycisphaeraceae bacterium]HRJ49368.1 hypothetical protein [Phycisphaerales bacterium]
MRRTTLLRHDLPNGHTHADWLVQTSDRPEAPVLAFRLRTRVDRPGLVLFSAERLPDHRAFYLDHAGPVSGGRGTVTPIARGVLLDFEDRGGRIKLRVDFGGGERRYRGVSASGGMWIFEHES